MGAGGALSAYYAGQPERDRKAREAAALKQIGDSEEADLKEVAYRQGAEHQARVAMERLRSPLDKQARWMSDSIKAADEGVRYPYGDVWNRREFDEVSGEADLLTKDMDTAKAIIKGQGVQSDWDASGAAMGGPVPTEQTLPRLRGRVGMGGSMQTWGR